MIDWQTLMVGLVVLAACLYVGWRAGSRLRSLFTSKPLNLPSCGGCSGCDTTSFVKASITSPRECHRSILPPVKIKTN